MCTLWVLGSLQTHYSLWSRTAPEGLLINKNCSKLNQNSENYVTGIAPTFPGCLFSPHNPQSEKGQHSLYKACPAEQLICAHCSSIKQRARERSKKTRPKDRLLICIPSSCKGIDSTQRTSAATIPSLFFSLSAVLTRTWISKC